MKRKKIEFHLFARASFKLMIEAEKRGFDLPLKRRFSLVSRRTLQAANVTICGVL